MKPSHEVLIMLGGVGIKSVNANAIVTDLPETLEGQVREKMERVEAARDLANVDIFPLLGHRRQISPPAAVCLSSSLVLRTLARPSSLSRGGGEK